MNDNRNDPLPEEFVSLLVDYDEALASGSIELPDAPSGQALDPRLEGRLERAHSCLQRIERLRRSGADALASYLTSISKGSAATVCQQGDTLHEVDDATMRPKTVGRFQIVRELGRGGCGVVFLAVDPDLEREVALKLPHPEVVLSTDLRERFLREGKAVAGLNHANVLPVFEAGTAGPVCYLAAAYCPGPSLKQWLDSRREPVPAKKAAALLVAIADGVQHAHNRGVVHRDLKPSNVLLKQYDKSSDPSDADAQPSLIPLVTDFGLAKTAETQSDQTRAGAIIGTPSYMAPEQAAGRVEGIGPAADVYALGSILYEMLVGEPPFCKETDLATLRAVEQDDPVRPARLRPGIPRDLEAVCLKCLEKDPSRRYVSASELADDLQRFMAGRPVRARHTGRAERLFRWCRRNPVVAGLSSAVLLLLVALSVGSTVAAIQLMLERDRTRTARDDAKMHFVEADRQRQRAETNLSTLRDAVDKMLTEVGFSRLVSQAHMGSVRRNLLENALHFYQQILDQEGESPKSRNDIGMALLRLGMTNRWLGNNPQAVDYLQRAVDEFRSLSARDPDHEPYRMQIAECYYQLAEINVILSQFDDAASLYRDAVAICRALSLAAAADHDGHLLLARTLNGLGYLLGKSGHMAEAEKVLRDAIAIEEKCREQEPSNQYVDFELASSRHNLALLLAHTRRIALAEESYRESLRLKQSLVEKNPLPDRRQALAGVCDDLGVLLIQSGDLDQSESNIRRGLKIRQELAAAFPGVADYRAKMATSFTNLGWLLARSSRAREAEDAYRQSIITLSELVEDHPRVRVYLQSLAKVQNNLGILLQSVDRPEEAEQLARSSLQTQRRLAEEFPDVPDFQSQLGASLHTVATLLKKRGEIDEPVRLLQEAVQLQAAALETNDQHPTYRQFLRNHYFVLTDVLASQLEFDAAALTVQKRIELYPDSWIEHYYGVRKLLAMRQQIISDSSTPADDREVLADSLRALALRVLANTKERIPQQISKPSQLNNLALLLAASPDQGVREPALAVEYMRRALAQHPDHANVKFFWATFGIANVTAGKWQEGKQALEKSIELDPTNTPAWFALAIACHELGDPRRAKSAYQRAMTQMEAIPTPSTSLLYLRDAAQARLAGEMESVRSAARRRRGMITGLLRPLRGRASTVDIVPEVRCATSG